MRILKYGKILMYSRWENHKLYFRKKLENMYQKSKKIYRYPLTQQLQLLGIRPRTIN